MATKSSSKIGRDAKTGTFVSTVTSKNQVTLSQAVRDAAGIRAGANVIITPLPGGRIMIREKSGTIANLAGAALKQSTSSRSEKSVAGSALAQQKKDSSNSAKAKSKK